MSLVNDARLVARGLRSAVSAPALPWKLTCAVTWRCAQRCTHCRIWRRPAGDELTVAQWARVFASVGPALSWLDLTGGEVTSRADFGALARAALDACPSLALLHFPTNGENPGAVEAVARELQGGHARFVVSISLDGPPQLHDRLRGDPGAFDRAVDTWRRLRALGVETYFGMTLSDYTVAHVDATRAALADAVPGFQWTDLHVNLLHVSPHYFQNEKVAHRTGRAASADVVAELVRRRGLPRHPTHLVEWLYQRNVPAYVRTGRSPVPCGSLAVNAFIDPAGTVYPCHIWDRPIGRLPEHAFDLGAVWALPERGKARADVAADRCPGCWTPCEAYPSVMADLARATAGALRG